MYENKQNVGADYIANLFSIYSKADAERYVYGRRGTTGGDRAFFQYRPDLHRTGNMSTILAGKYDPYEKLVLSYDFNVYPMSVSVWQPKWWSDAWEDLILLNSRVWVDPVSGRESGSVEDFGAPTRRVLAQIDEIEVWPDDPLGGMTKGMTRHIEEKYAGHEGFAVVLGDASGNQRRSSSDTTDWQIIGQSMKQFRQPVVYRGLISNTNLKTGQTTYSNPSQRDALQNANRVLMDGNGQVHICFLPESSLPSGGVAVLNAARSCCCL